MRIGIIASPRQSMAEPFAGGMEAHTAQLAEALRTRGHEVAIHAAADDAAGGEPFFDGGEPLRLSGTARSDPTMCPESFLAEHHAYLELMLRLDSLGYDVAHNNSLHYLPVAHASALDTPVVSTLHTPPTPWLESAIRARVDTRSPHWVSVSAANAALWRGLGSGCEVIHNGVDVSRWRFNAKPVEGTAVWSGRIVPEKGTHLALEAARLAGLDLTVAGPVGDHEYFESEVRPLLDSGIGTYAGHVATEELSALVGSAEVALVTPRWDEPFGLVAIEAFSCGTPVAAFSRGALPEIVDDAVGALSTGEDPATLAAAALDARSRSRAACRRRAVEHFSLDAMVDAYERTYARAAAG